MPNSTTMPQSYSSDGVVLTDPFKFTNDGDGFKRLSEELSDYTPEPAIIGLESTAHYSDNLVRYLVANNYKVYAQPYSDFVPTEGSDMAHLSHLLKTASHVTLIKRRQDN